MHWQKIIWCLKSMICHFQRILWTFYCIYYGLGDVFVVYCKDKVSQNLSPDNLYNPKLHSVESHPVLRKLKERERVLSVNTKFHPHQVSHMESCCKNIMWCDVKYLPFSLCIIALTLIILWAFMKCYLLLCYWAECSSELFWSPVVRLWVRRPSACPSLRKRSHFHFLPQNQLDNFNPTWHKSSLGDVNSCLFK